MSITVVELDDPGVVRGQAQNIFGKFSGTVTAMDQVSDSWSGITAYYDAPEGYRVATGMRTPEQITEEFKGAGEKTRTALNTYADALDGLHRERNALIADIQAYEREVASSDDDYDREERESKYRELQSRAQRLAQAKDEAQNACRSSLGFITTTASLPRHSASPVPTANEGRSRNFAEKMWSRFIRDNSLTGALALGVRGSLLTLDTLGNSSMVMNFRNTVVNVRQGWLPGSLQSLAAKGGFRQSLVKSLTGWDATKITNKGQFLARNSMMNPMRNPKGIKDTFRVIAGRTMLQLKGNSNRVPKAHKAASVSKWSKVGKWGGRAATAISAGVNFYSSWQQDSQHHPNMGVVEKATRSTVQAAGATAGGWAGAKAGAALGASVGSLGGPVGTAVGAVVGGIAGSVIGSEVGGAVANKVKGVAGKAAGWVASLFGN